MSELKVTESALTRRTLPSAIGVAPALLVAKAYATPPKVSQASVAFLAAPRGDKRCGDCKLFQAPSSRLDVAGVIGQDCGCRIWLPQVD